STVSFTGAAPEIAGASATTFNNLTLNNSTGATLTTAPTNNGTLTLTAGAVTGNLTLANGATISLNTGSLSTAPTFGANLNVTYTGSTPATIGARNEIPLGGNLGTGLLTVNNTGGCTLDSTVGTVSSTGGAVGSGATLTVTTGGVLKNAGTFTPTGTLSFTGTGKYQHNFTTTAGAIPTATWAATSTCEIIGYTTDTSVPTGLVGQAFGNFTWNCPSQTGNINLGGTLTTVNGNFTIVNLNTATLRLASSQSTTLAIVGNLSIQQGNVEAATTTGSPTINVTGDVIISSGGILDLASGGSSGTVTLNVSGNVSVPGGATLKKTTAAQTGNITFAKSGTQTLTSGGTISGAIGWTVNSGSVLDLGASVISGSGTFNLSSGAGIITAHTSGLNGNITVSGTKTFSTGANYTYNGNSSQGTGNRLPTTVNNFTVANTGGNGANIVTLSQNLTVNGTPTISSGVLAIGGNTLTVSAPASGSFGAGGITVGTGGILAIDPSVVDGTLVDLTSVGIIAGTLKFDFASAAPSASVAPFQINADASALSASSATLTIANAGSLSFGTYPLITFASGTPSTSGFITQNLPVGGSLAISGSTINLVVSPPLTPVFSGLSSPTVIYGAASVVLTGTCKNGTRYPVNGDAITATINGHTSSSGTFDSSGNFTIAYNDASLATNGIAGSPYTIIYDYGGHSGTLTPASDGSAALTVNQRPVNLTGTRVYDGTTNAAAAILSVTNVINGDTVTVNSGTGGLAGANSGTRALTSLGDLAIAGASVGNYTLTGAGGSVTIGTAPVTPTVTANSKAYDGNTNATIATRSLTGVIGGDDVTLVGGTASFTDKNVGTGKAVNITGLGLSGTTAGNYVLNTTSTNTSADIASGTVTIVSGLSAHNKMYDGTNVATLSSNNVVLAGVLVGDEGNVTLVTNGYTASFGDINADTNKPVTVSNLTLTGGAAANYTLTQPVLAADVTPATVTVVSGLMADNKIYDTTSTATFTSNNVVLAGVVNADTNDVYLVTSGYTATFAGTNAGTSISVTVSGLALGGSAVTNNYTLTQPTLSADITQAPVTPTVTANNKVYDGTTNATIATRSLTGVIGGDDVTLVSGTASFTDKNVGTGKAVNITGLSLSGTTAGNYVLNTTATNTSADITGRTLTVGATGVNKAYDGTTNATVTLSDDRVSGDNLTIAYTAAFEDPNVGTGKPVQVTGISITGGADQNNYALGNTATQTTADITAASVSVTVSSSLNPSGFGDSVTFTATVPPDASGNVIFKANGTPLGTNLLSTGTATNLTAALLRGTNTITAEYSGDGSYLGSTNALSGGQMVTNHPPTASASTNDCTQGLSVTIQITGAGGLASDSDGDALALAATTPSLGTNYLFSAGGTNYIYYQNTNSAAGSDSFDYTVDDGYGGLATNTITINLVVPNGLSQNSLATPETIGAGPDVRLKYLGLPTYKYALEWTHDLTPTITWSALITNTAGGTGLVIYTNTPSGGRDFYRTRWVP
ncbi:MAG: hypothetical protein JWR19_2498, partial [Pedosphaera sp.]|nr:hypothetical protein [Pedosphaera sp.]